MLAGRCCARGVPLASACPNPVSLRTFASRVVDEHWCSAAALPAIRELNRILAGTIPSAPPRGASSGPLLFLTSRQDCASLPVDRTGFGPGNRGWLHPSTAAGPDRFGGAWRFGRRRDSPPAADRHRSAGRADGFAWPSRATRRSARVAIIDVDGLLLNTDMTGPGAMGENPVSLFRERLDRVACDRRVVAVVVRINSPGGGVTASDMMWHDLMAFKAQTQLPVVASVLDLGAGGGYYLSTAADQIVAHPTSVIGGIGVILNLYNLRDTMAQFNVIGVPIKAGKKIDLGSPIDSPSTTRVARSCKIWPTSFTSVFARWCWKTASSRSRRPDEFRRPHFHRFPSRRARAGRQRRLSERRHRRRGRFGRLPARHRHVLSPRRRSGRLGLSDHAQRSLAKWAAAAQPAGTRPQPAADLPLSVAGRPDDGEAGGQVNHAITASCRPAPLAGTRCSVRAFALAWAPAAVAAGESRPKTHSSAS